MAFHVQISVLLVALPLPAQIDAYGVSVHVCYMAYTYLPSHLILSFIVFCILYSISFALLFILNYLSTAGEAVGIIGYVQVCAPVCCHWPEADKTVTKRCAGSYLAHNVV